MAPEQIGDATLAHADCLTAMERIPDGSVDMVLCDLPYGTTSRNAWDSVIPLDPLWEHYRRVIKPSGAIVLTAQQPFASLLIASNPAWFRYEWIWAKNRAGGFLSANRMPLRAHENILVFYGHCPTYNPQYAAGKPYRRPRGYTGSNYGEADKVVTINEDGRRFPTSVLSVPLDEDGRGLHPTQKPAALFAYLIRTYTNPGDLVLDSCAGSGTTGVACQQEGRRCILIERDPGYYQTMRARLSAPRQTRLAEGA